jgi:hypothetical protein
MTTHDYQLGYKQKLAQLKKQTNTFISQPSYSFFLFSKLYSLIVNVDDYAYDVLYDDILGWYQQYDSSIYNESTKPEYECMVNYIQLNKNEMKINASLSALSC